MDKGKNNRIWTVAEAKGRPYHFLRLAEEDGPQRIGKRRSFVLVPAEAWYAKEKLPEPSQKRGRKPMGQWLVENMPRGIELELPSRRERERAIPFAAQDDE